MGCTAVRGVKGNGSIRKRSNGTWEARYTAGRDPGTGKQIQRSVYGATKEEVRKKLAQITAELDSGTFLEPCKLTVGEWLTIWLDEYNANIKPRTKQSYDENCRNHIKPALGAVKLSVLSPHMVQSFYNNCFRGDETTTGLSAKTVKNIHGVFHKALMQAVRLGYIKSNPADACIIPRQEPRKITPLEENEITAFLHEVKGHPYENVYLVTLFMGLRQGEVLGLTWDCIDFDHGTVTVNKQLQRDRANGTYILAATKNDKPRYLQPAQSVMLFLKAEWKKQVKCRLVAGEKWDNPLNMVFTNELGRNLSAQTVYLHFKKLAAAIQRPDARFHDLRHSYAVAALQSGDDVKTVQENLGHHTAAFTLDVYGHVSKQMKQNSAQRMERFIQSVTAS